MNKNKKNPKFTDVAGSLYTYVKHYANNKKYYIRVFPAKLKKMRRDYFDHNENFMYTTYVNLG